ncbi:MAG TPA: hypothetical protein VK827_02625 [Lysobacter sp.]|nr:hypothetical protein [Lysobacter sp.]
MSIRSKAKRDARKKKAARNERETVRPSIEPHAELRDGHGVLLGGIARQDEEWVLGLDGQIVGGSTSPATVLAMLKRAAAMQERAGHAIELKFSAALREAAQEEARAQGKTLEEFEAQLDESLQKSGGTPGGVPASPLRH